MEKELYHGSLADFDFFDESYLGGNISDIMSFLGFHFTEDKSLARNLFSYSYENGAGGYVYTINVSEYSENTYQALESEIILNILAFGVDEGLVTSQFYKEMEKLPYWNSFGEPCIVKKLYNNGKRPNSKNFIDKQELSYRYKKALLNQGIELIKYKNEIEWSGDNRFDYIILNSDTINIVNKEFYE